MTGQGSGPRRRRERETEQSPRMSDHEALMWNIEKDPWLNPNGASLTMLDQPVDRDRFVRQLRFGISKMPRLYQRVVPGLGRLSTPAWVPDPEFDFDYHVRQIELPAPGTRRQLMDLATQLYEEPLDRTRPLWRFVLIGGVEGGRGALYALTHHAIADGIGQLRMAELYQQLSRDEAMPPEVDLEAIIASAVKRHGAKESGGDLASSLISTATRTMGHLVRRQIGAGRRLAGEMMLWPVDPGRIVDQAGTVGATVEQAAGLLTRTNAKEQTGSPLWVNRSRHRRLEYVRLPLEDLKAAGKALGGSVNDAFMVGLTEAAVRYHRDRGVKVEAFNTSLIVSTRTDAKIGGNSFTPVLIQVAGQPAPFKVRMAQLRTAVADAMSAAGRTGGITGLSGAVNLLPTSVVTRTARAQAAKIDFATSNLRGAPIPLYCAGAKVEATVCMGPVAGTAVNATALSYDGHFDVGLFMDPKAIDDPEAYRRHVEESFADLLAPNAPSPSHNGAAAKAAANGGTRRTAKAEKKPATKKAATTRQAAKKAGSKRSPAKKAATKRAPAKKAAAKKAVTKKAVTRKAPPSASPTPTKRATSTGSGKKNAGGTPGNASTIASNGSGE